MNEQELAEIKARAEAATPGPWHHDSEYNIHDPNPVLVASIRHWKGDLNYPLICEVRYPRQAENEANINFIAHARTDVPALVAEVERLKEENARLNGIIIRYQLTKKALANHTAYCDVCETNDYCEVGDRLIKDHIIARLDLDEGGKG